MVVLTAVEAAAGVEIVSPGTYRVHDVVGEAANDPAYLHQLAYRHVDKQGLGFVVDPILIVDRIKGTSIRH
eukprot:7676554-Heterocapsa_arctica.AAC.1